MIFGINSVVTEFEGEIHVVLWRFGETTLKRAF